VALARGQTPPGDPSQPQTQSQSQSESQSQSHLQSEVEAQEERRMGKMQKEGPVNRDSDPASKGAETGTDKGTDTDTEAGSGTAGVSLATRVRVGGPEARQRDVHAPPGAPGPRVAAAGAHLLSSRRLLWNSSSRRPTPASTRSAWAAGAEGGEHLRPGP